MAWINSYASGKFCNAYIPTQNFPQNFYWHLGSIWIGLILLKLKTYCWNHCSKIIFKCVNSAMGPIFNEKITEKWNLWVHKPYMIHCLLQKSQHLRLLFIEQYMNSNRVLPKRVKKKKKKQKQKRKTQTWVQNVNPNIHLNERDFEYLCCSCLGNVVVSWIVR